MQSYFSFADSDDNIRAALLSGVSACAVTDLQCRSFIEALNIVVAVACGIGYQKICAVVVFDKIVSRAAVYRSIVTAVNDKVIIARAAVDKIIIAS